MKANDLIDFLRETKTGFIVSKSNKYWGESDWTDDVNAAKIYPTAEEAGDFLVGKIKAKQFEVADDYDVLKVKVT